MGCGRIIPAVYSAHPPTTPILPAWPLYLDGVSGGTMEVTHRGRGDGGADAADGAVAAAVAAAAVAASAGDDEGDGAEAIVVVLDECFRDDDGVETKKRWVTVADEDWWWR